MELSATLQSVGGGVARNDESQGKAQELDGKERVERQRNVSIVWRRTIVGDAADGSGGECGEFVDY